jgi:2'-5' RNA ligase
MRLFIATDLPHDVVSAVSALRSALGEPDSVRWGRNESMHLTIRFLGETPGDRIGPIDAALREIRQEPFEVVVCGVGFFPNERAPRVFWAGVRSKGLARLAGEVERRIIRLGFEAERRPFKPHLALARVPRSGRMDPRFVEKARAFRGREFGAFRTDRFFLYRSRLEPCGAVYERLNEYPLATGR